jgi:hypothetical protein
MNAADLVPAVRHRIDGLPGTDPGPYAPLGRLLDDPLAGPVRRRWRRAGARNRRRPHLQPYRSRPSQLVAWLRSQGVRAIHGRPSGPGPRHSHLPGLPVHLTAPGPGGDTTREPGSATSKAVCCSGCRLPGQLRSGLGRRPAIARADGSSKAGASEPARVTLVELRRTRRVDLGRPGFSTPACRRTADGRREGGAMTVGHPVLRTTTTMSWSPFPLLSTTKDGSERRPRGPAHLEMKRRG